MSTGAFKLLSHDLTNASRCRNSFMLFSFHQHNLLSLSLFPLRLFLSHAPSLTPTHAHPHCTTGTCNLELHFCCPSLFYLYLSLSPPSLSLSPALPSVFHMQRCFCLYSGDQNPIGTRAGSYESFLHPLLFFLCTPSAAQIKSTLYCSNGKEACTLHFMSAFWVI